MLNITSHLGSVNRNHDEISPCDSRNMCVLSHIQPSLPGSSVHGIFQVRILNRVAISPGDLADPGIESGSPALAGRFFTTVPPGKVPVRIAVIRKTGVKTISKDVEKREHLCVVGGNVY